MKAPRKDVVIFLGIFVVLFVGKILMTPNPLKNLQTGNGKTAPAKNEDPRYQEGLRLFYEQRCMQCHTFYGSGGVKGPDLTFVRDNLKKRLATYEDYIQQLQSVYPEESKKLDSLLQKILKAKDMERVELWLSEHLKNPTFDNPETQMPIFGFTDEKISALVFFLLHHADP
ncbi:MAG: c-type cytochrome [Planctomycetota bacterium]